MLVLGRSFFYTPDASFSEEFPLQFLLLVRIFSYTPNATFGEEFLLHSSSWI